MAEDQKQFRSVREKGKNNGIPKQYCSDGKGAIPTLRASLAITSDRNGGLSIVNGSHGHCDVWMEWLTYQGDQACTSFWFACCV
jgi:hypothetical protein